jgi:hypothetical protein
MARYRYFKDQTGALISQTIATTPDGVALPAAAAASALGGVEAFRQVRFEDLPAEVIRQLRTDGTRGDLRDLDGARGVFAQNVPAEARGSIEGVEAITNDPSIHWMHSQPHASGGDAEAGNGLYGPAELNQAIGDRPMTQAEISEAEASTLEVAEAATPGVTGDLVEVAVDTLETGAFGGVMGGGLAAVHRLAQAQGYRDAGRHDLAALAEGQIGKDAAMGAINGVVRGTSIAMTQAVLGANPFTAGIGLVAPDVVALLSQKDTLSEREYDQKAMAVVGKGVLATVLVCAGPLGWMGLAGVSIASAYSKASQQRGGGEQPA